MLKLLMNIALVEQDYADSRDQILSHDLTERADQRFGQSVQFGFEVSKGASGYVHLDGLHIPCKVAV